MREFAKNAILSCHLAIFVSLIPFLKGVGCKMNFQNLAYAGGQAGTFGVWFSRPPAYVRGFAKNAILSCHLAIFVFLIPFLKGVGCKMKFQNLAYAGGQERSASGFPARPPTHEGFAKNCILSYTLHPLFGI